jgi:hypothetical protein
MQEIFIMLTRQTQTHFYANRDDTVNFEEFCAKMQLFSEGSEWQRLNLIKWQTISLSKVISVNSELSIIKCLQKMRIELDTIQRSIDSRITRSLISERTSFKSVASIRRWQINWSVRLWISRDWWTIYTRQLSIMKLFRKQKIMRIISKWRRFSKREWRSVFYWQTVSTRQQ